jgi:cell wall-associated NlpC family hydrolase
MSFVMVGATTVLVSPTAQADSVTSAKVEAAAIAASLAAAQNKMSALGQQYDTARVQLTQVENAIATTKAAVAQKQQQVVHDKRLLEKAAVASYVSDGSAVADNPLFSSNEKTQGAANEYSQIATGDIDEAVANLNTAKNKLSAQQTQLTVQKKQAQSAVASEQAALAANQLVEQQQSTALAQENSEIATLVAQQQQVQIAAAAKAAQAQIATAAAVQASHVAAQSAAASTPQSSAPGAGTKSGGNSGSGSASAPTPYVPLPVAPGGGGAVSAAETQLGVPYVWGGQSPGVGFDCSGLVQWAWRQAGVSLPRTSGAQFAATTPVSIADLEPGDLLFYGPSGSDHVAMYVGGGMMIEAPETGEVVHITPLRLGGYGESFAGAGRP